MSRGPEYQKERSERQRARILSLLCAHPMSKRQVSSELFMHPETASGHLTIMRRLGMIHIGGHFLDDKSGMGRVVPVYYPGNLPDVKYTSVRERMRIQTQEHSAYRKKLVEQALQDGPRRSDQISLAIGLSVGRTRTYIRQMRLEGKVYIAKWGIGAENNYTFPLYGLGSKKDAKQPKMTTKQYYKKLKKSVERYGKMIDKKMAADAVKKHLRKPQSIFSALGL